MNYSALSKNDDLTISVSWLASFLTGSAATSVAVLAIAAVGLLMLGGRVPVRRGATVIVGCFILFSAATIAGGLLSAVGGAASSAPIPSPEPAYTPTVPTGSAADPYAGAAVPAQR